MVPEEDRPLQERQCPELPHQVNACTHTHTHTHTLPQHAKCIHTRMNTCTHLGHTSVNVQKVHVHTLASMHMCVCVCAYTQSHKHTCIIACVCTHSVTNARTHASTVTQTRIHTSQPIWYYCLRNIPCWHNKQCFYATEFNMMKGLKYPRLAQSNTAAVLPLSLAKDCPLVGKTTVQVLSEQQWSLEVVFTELKS